MRDRYPHVMFSQSRDLFKFVEITDKW